jgi:hypothetical protein
MTPNYTDEQIDRAVQVFQIAEMEYGEKMQAKGVLFDPALGVEHALRIVLDNLANPIPRSGDAAITDEIIKAFRLAYFSGPVRSLSPYNERLRRALEAVAEKLNTLTPSSLGSGDAVDARRVDFLERNARRLSFGVNENRESDVYWFHAQGIGYRVGENLRLAIDAIHDVLEAIPSSALAKGNEHE